jgi:hypothetical protein
MIYNTQNKIQVTFFSFKMMNTLVAFDFDETIITVNSDVEVPRLTSIECFEASKERWRAQSRESSNKVSQTTLSFQTRSSDCPIYFLALMLDFVHGLCVLRSGFQLRH